MGQQGDRSDTLTGGGYADPGFGDTTARQEKPSHLVDLPNAPAPNFGDTTAKQSKPPDVYALEADTIKGGALPDIPSKDDAVTIKDNHKKTMQSAVAVDLVPSPETRVPSTLDDDDPEPAQAPARPPRVGPPTLASPGIPQAEWDSAAYPHIERPAPSPNMPPPNVAPLGPPMGYGPPQAAGSGSYAQAQPRAPLPPTYRIKREGSGGGQVALILVAIGFCFAIFAAGILVFVSKRMTPTVSTRSTPPAEIAPAGSAAPTPATTSTTPPLQVESQPPATGAAPPPTTPPRATPSSSPKGPKSPKAPKGQLQDNR